MRQVGPCLWVDIAHQWRAADRPALGCGGLGGPSRLASNLRDLPAARLIDDLNQLARCRPRKHPDAHRRMDPPYPVPPSTIGTYLSENIHYALTPECVAAIQLFRAYATEAGCASHPRLGSGFCSARFAASGTGRAHAVSSTPGERGATPTRLVPGELASYPA